MLWQTHSRNVLAREFVRGVRYQETGLREGDSRGSREREGGAYLANSTVSNNDTLDCLHLGPRGLLGQAIEAGRVCTMSATWMNGPGYAWKRLSAPVRQ